MCILADQQTSRVVKFRNLLCSETLNALLTTRMSVRKSKGLFFKYILCTGYLTYDLPTGTEFMEEQRYLWWLHVHNACCSWSISCRKKLWIRE